jgi:hypothetical protein
LLYAAALDLHDDLRTVRIQCIFDQLFDHGRRPLNYLASGDLGSQSRL